MKRVRRAIDTASCVRARANDRAREKNEVIARWCGKKFFDIAKMPME